MKKLLSLLIILTYPVLFSVIIGTFYLFRPYRVLDHQKTTIICVKNNMTYEAGPNLIYAFSETLDPQTDKNVRKLCEYSIMGDYQDSYKAPEMVNYKMIAAYEQRFNWVDTLLVTFVIALIGFAFMEKARTALKIHAPNVYTLVIFSLILGVFIFLTTLYSPLKKLWCERKVASTLHNFKKSAYGYGLQRIQQEEKYLSPVIKSEYEICIR